MEVILAWWPGTPRLNLSPSSRPTAFFLSLSQLAPLKAAAKGSSFKIFHSNSNLKWSKKMEQ